MESPYNGHSRPWPVFRFRFLRQIAAESRQPHRRDNGGFRSARFDAPFGVRLCARSQQACLGREPRAVELWQQALGFFGNRTPGSPPSPEELVIGSSQMPQLRFPPAPEGALTGAAGYYNLLPFAGFVAEGSGIGLAALAFKFNLLSETSGAPVGLAARAHFDIPIRKGIDYLLLHPVGTADLQFGFDAIVSRNVADVAGLYWNLGYRHINQPAHVSIVRLADEAPVGFGWKIPRTTRVQFVGEATAEMFLGSHTPNTTFGAEDPTDLTVGGRIGVLPQVAFSAGYRRRLNKPEGDKNGFVIQAVFTSAKP